jgi:hypothetical protein
MKCPYKLPVRKEQATSFDEWIKETEQLLIEIGEK